MPIHSGRARTAPPLHNRAPEQLVDAAALAFGGTSRATSPNGHRHGFLVRRRRRALVDVALGGHGGADALGDDAGDDHNALAPLVPRTDLVTDPDNVRGLDPHPVTRT
ncbi:hypothetical protein MPTA5024_18840 [Microbispora sp. ATCC PTA-5024]|nr:hypothetical protein MPTA5024_18840 [Microbispora sp. ATCC PTA-5024]